MVVSRRSRWGERARNGRRKDVGMLGENLRTESVESVVKKIVPAYFAAFFVWASERACILLVCTFIFDRYVIETRGIALAFYTDQRVPSS